MDQTPELASNKGVSQKGAKHDAVPEAFEPRINFVRGREKGWMLEMPFEANPIERRLLRVHLLEQIEDSVRVPDVGWFAGTIQGGSPTNRGGWFT